MRKIIATPNEAKTAFAIPSEYSKSLLLKWFKEYTRFEITPIIPESYKARGYLEGAVIPQYCKWQYDIDPRDPQRDEARRFLFKKDFHYEVVKDRSGSPVRAPRSSKGMASEILNAWTEWASENGCPIPNPELYKLWRDEWSMDPRFPSFFEFLGFIGVECDAMPSKETLNVLH